MSAKAALSEAIHVDPSRNLFKVSRRNFTDPDILEAEREQIFDRCWLYLGHDSELAQPGDFVTRVVAGRPILFTRDKTGELHAMFNTCPHRGATVCRERQGNANAFQCFYHGWTFDQDGRLRGMPGKESYADDFNADGGFVLQEMLFRIRNSRCTAASRSSASIRRPSRWSTTWLAAASTSISSPTSPRLGWRSSAARRSIRSAPTGSC